MAEYWNESGHLDNPKWSLKHEYLPTSDAICEVEIKNERMLIHSSESPLVLSQKAFEELFWLFDAWQEYWND